MQQLFSSVFQIFRGTGSRRLAAFAVLILGSASVVVGTYPRHWSARSAHETHALVDTIADLTPSADFAAAADEAANDSPSKAQTFDDGGVPRPLYPYSVVPGGVRSAAEIRAAESQDSAVRAHYAGINVALAHMQRLDAAKLVYVSYRRGNRIFWTKSALRLGKGETVITDGSNMLRARCGNRISEAPMAPVEAPEAAVAPAEMELPEAPGLPLPLDAAAMDLPLAPIPATAIEVPPAPPVIYAGGPGGYAPPFYTPPVGSGSKTPTSPAGPTTPAGPPSGPGTPSGPGSPSGPSGPGAPGTSGQPPVAAAEPGEFAMLFAGLAGVSVFLRKRREA
jgi:hypothetical protein